MPSWVDIRVPRDDYGEALKVLLSSQPGSLELRVELEPAAAGPEVEISVKDMPEREICALLELAGIEAFATRVRLGVVA